MINLKACAGALGIIAGVATSPAAPAGANETAPRWAAPMPQEETIYRPECPVGETSVRLPLQFAGPGEGQR
jgi:hypothetical protein